MSPLQVGAWLVPHNLVLLVGTLVAPRLEVRFGSLLLVCGGLGIAGAGLALLGALDADTLLLHLTALVLAAEGISAAPSAAAQSPELAAPILQAARVAFTQGYNVIGVLAGAAMIVLAVVAGRVLGRTSSAAAETTSTLPEPACEPA